MLLKKSSQRNCVESDSNYGITDGISNDVSNEPFIENVSNRDDEQSLFSDGSEDSPSAETTKSKDDDDENKTVNDGEISKCDISGDGCNRNSALDRRTNCHSEKRSFECEICGKPFKYLPDLKKHFYRVHRKKYKSAKARMPRMCAICGKSFKSLSTLREHNAVHATDKPFQCEVCDYKAKTKERLRRHIHANHDTNRVYNCKECGAVFDRWRSLDNHRREHLKVSFFCHFCPKSFKTNEHFKLHLNTHSDERPYSCKVCGKAYKTKATLKEHNQTHTTELLFACSECDKR